MYHVLDVKPPQLDRLLEGKQRADWRRELGAAFEVGDELVLCEADARTRERTGRGAVARVTDVRRGDLAGDYRNVCLLSFELVCGFNQLRLEADGSVNFVPKLEVGQTVFLAGHHVARPSTGCTPNVHVGPVAAVADADETDEDEGLRAIDWSRDGAMFERGAEFGRREQDVVRRVAWEFSLRRLERLLAQLAHRDRSKTADGPWRVDLKGLELDVADVEGARNFCRMVREDVFGEHVRPAAPTTHPGVAGDMVDCVVDGKPVGRVSEAKVYQLRELAMAFLRVVQGGRPAGEGVLADEVVSRLEAMREVLTRAK